LTYIAVEKDVLYVTIVFQLVSNPEPPPELLSAGTNVLHDVDLVVDLEYPVLNVVVVDLLVFLSVTLDVFLLVPNVVVVFQEVVHVVVVN